MRKNGTNSRTMYRSMMRMVGDLGGTLLRNLPHAIVFKMNMYYNSLTAQPGRRSHR
jgi:hypothetical protein